MKKFIEKCLEAVKEAVHLYFQRGSIDRILSHVAQDAVWLSMENSSTIQDVDKIAAKLFKDYKNSCLYLLSLKEENYQVIRSTENSCTVFCVLTIERKGSAAGKSRYTQSAVFTLENREDGPKIVLLHVALSEGRSQEDGIRLRMALEHNVSIIFEYDVESDLICFYEAINTEQGKEIRKKVMENYRTNRGKRIHPRYQPAFIQDILGGKKTELEILFQEKEREDSYTWWKIQSQTILEGDKLIRVIGTVRNIARMKALEGRNDRLYHIVDKIINEDYDYFSLVDIKTGEYQLFVSDKKNYLHVPVTGDYNQATGELKEKIIYQEDKDSYVRNVVLSNVLKELKRRESHYEYQYRVEIEKGMVQWKSIRFSFLNEEKSVILFRVLDITKMKKKEEKTHEAIMDALALAQQANVAKSDFLSRMSHEIRTPMNAIIGMSTIAENYIENSEKLRDCLEKIGVSARFLLDLINDILDMSRIESGKLVLTPELFDFKELMNQIITMIYPLAQERGLNFHAVVEGAVEDYYIGDALRIKQILLNILSNALKFTSRGGDIHFQVQQIFQGRDYAALLFCIEDTGIGMSPLFMEHLYEPFQQEQNGMETKYDGSGLGLAICKNLVSLMEGKMKVKSTEGKGTRFHIEIKVGLKEKKKTHTEEKKGLPFEVLNAIIVDDDPITCEQTNMILKDLGISSQWAYSGEEAVSLVEESLKNGAGYNIAFIDWKMDKIAGIETTRELRKRVGEDTLLVVMSAYDLSGIQEEGKKAGADYFISKPFFQSTLYDMLKEIIGKQKHAIRTKNIDACDFTGKKILLVEDNALNIEIAQEILKMKNFCVDIAENGMIAVEKFIHSGVGYYDGILMDIRMPVMDGLTAAQEIRKSGKEDAASIPIIAMTANAFDEDIEKSRDSGMNAHLTKPIETAELFRLLDQLLGKRES